MSIGSDHMSFQTFNDILIIGIPKLIDFSIASKLEKELLVVLEKRKKKGIIFDFHNIDVMDDTDIHYFQSMVKVAQLMGVPSVFCGLSDSLVAGLITLNIEMKWCKIVTTIEDGVRLFS